MNSKNDNNTNRSTNAAIEKVTKESLPDFQMLLGIWLQRFVRTYHQELDSVAVECYREALKKLTAKQLDRACMQALKTSEFMPTPATILKCHEAAVEAAWGDAPDNLYRDLPAAESSHPELEAATSDDIAWRDEIHRKLCEIGEKVGVKKSTLDEARIRQQKYPLPPPDVDEQEKPAPAQQAKKFAFTHAPKSAEQQIAELNAHLAKHGADPNSPKN